MICFEEESEKLRDSEIVIEVGEVLSDIESETVIDSEMIIGVVNCKDSKDGMVCWICGSIDCWLLVGFPSPTARSSERDTEKCFGASESATLSVWVTSVSSNSDDSDGMVSIVSSVSTKAIISGDITSSESSISPYADPK